MAAPWNSRSSALAAPWSDAEEVNLPRAELARAARILALRTRREVRGIFAGAYTSAFRGGGMEFDESRPYAPGDDVRSLDWNAMARTGEPFVKHFREERDQTLMLALDVSGSMRFGTTGRSKAAVAAHAAALISAAAGNAGDRVGLLAFDTAVRSTLPAARGASHTWRVIETAALAAGSAGGNTSLAAGLAAIQASVHRPSVVVVLSDFRDPSLLSDRNGRGPLEALTALARRHDVVSISLYDPREESLPRAGLVRIADPERPGRTWLVNSNRARTRARYRRAFATRALTLERALRATGSDVLWLRSDRDPLRTLIRFFRERAARSGGRAPRSRMTP